jgi:hypothetical protein
LDTILSEATTAVSKAENAQQLIYTNSDSVYNILKEYGGDWYVKLKDKANSADNYIREVKTAAGNVRSKQGTVKSTVSSLESNVSNLKSKMLQNQVSANLVKEYGDFLIHAVLGKAKVKQGEIESSIVSNVNISLDGYFAKGNEYSDKMESLKRNTDKIGTHIGNIETYSDELDTVSSEIVDFTKKQTEKIGLHHDSLVHKGKEFDEDARTVIEKNREVSLGVMKGKTSEILMAARSLGVMLSDKHEQVETYKEQLKDTGETFKHHEGVLVTQHGKHLDDVKSGKDENFQTLGKLAIERLNIIEQLRLENKDLKTKNDQYQEKISTMNLNMGGVSTKESEINMIDGTLKAIMGLIKIDIQDIQGLKGIAFTQQCLMKVIQNQGKFQ